MNLLSFYSLYQKDIKIKLVSTRGSGGGGYPLTKVIFEVLKYEK